MEAHAQEDRAGDSEAAELAAKLGIYPVARYPVQHATAAFHLATVHLQRGRVDQAVPLLSDAFETFGRLGMRLEQTKALTMHGVALREGGRNDLAAATFERAAQAFSELEQPAEEAAASYNLGLSLAQYGDPAAVRDAFTRAHELFLEEGHLAQAGAAARELGAHLLTSGEVGAALTVLDDAAALAQRAGDLPGLGAAANALGLAHLANDDSEAAVREFARAVGAYPRGLRARDHAMVKANLAVAHERDGNQPRARLAARQALAIASADPLVLDQARELLDRLSGDKQTDLLAVLDQEPAASWTAILREEVLRWCEASRAERVRAVHLFIEGLLARPGASYGLAECLVGVMLELSPIPYEEMVACVVQVTGQLAEPEEELVRAILGSAMARFAIPQWQRLAAGLNGAATAVGLPGGWR